MGDLIELNDAFEIGGAEDDETMQSPQASGPSRGKRSARVDQEALLRERFPLRGSMAGEDAKKNKGD
jgi:hypothetical protein